MWAPGGLFSLQQEAMLASCLYLLGDMWTKFWNANRQFVTRSSATPRYSGVDGAAWAVSGGSVNTFVSTYSKLRCVASTGTPTKMTKKQKRPRIYLAHLLVRRARCEQAFAGQKNVLKPHQSCWCGRIFQYHWMFQQTYWSMLYDIFCNNRMQVECKHIELFQLLGNRIKQEICRVLPHSARSNTYANKPSIPILIKAKDPIFCTKMLEPRN